jgi:hypothetical protein
MAIDDRRWYNDSRLVAKTIFSLKLSYLRAIQALLMVRWFS